MSDFAPWIILGGSVAYILYTVTSLATGEAKEKQDAASKIGVAKVGLYGRCVTELNCEGGGNTTLCENSRCVPRVAEDGIGRIRYSPIELGLKSACGKYYLSGMCDTCSETRQCSADGVAKYASDPSATSATLNSKFQCVQGQCRPTILAGSDRDYFRKVGDQNLSFLEQNKIICSDLVNAYNAAKTCRNLVG